GRNQRRGRTAFSRQSAAAAARPRTNTGTIHRRPPLFHPYRPPGVESTSPLRPASSHPPAPAPSTSDLPRSARPLRPVPPPPPLEVTRHTRPSDRAITAA